MEKCETEFPAREIHKFTPTLNKLSNQQSIFEIFEKGNFVNLILQQIIP